MNNETLKEVLEASELIPALWAEKHQIKNEVGLPIDFDGNHRFMREPFNDMSPLQAWLKPPQIGATTTQILKALYIAKKQGKQIIYTLPTAGDVYEMVGGSFNRLIAQNPILRDWVKDGDTTAHKFVGNGLIRFRGTFTDKQAMMYPSDLNMHDEVDASDPSIITLMETRLQAKADGMRWYWSHPTLATKGIDIYWQQSDKKEWFVRPTCNHEQVLTWPDNIKNARYACSKCGTSIDEEERRMGSWRATAQGIFSGYHISQLMCPWISAEKIIEAKEDPTKDEQFFYNYVLGLPYADSNDRLDPKDVLKNVTSAVNTQEGQIIFGVDPGLPFWVVGGNKSGLFYNASLSGKDPQLELERLLSRFPNSIMVIDQGGDFRSRVLMDKYPGRVFICYYRPDRKSTESARWQDDGSVVVDKHQMFTLLFDSLRDTGRINLNGKEEDWREFASHFGNFLRKKEDTPLGPRYIWESRKPDHLAHAFLYCMVGLMRFGDQEASIIHQDNWLKDLPKVDIDTSMRQFL